MCVEQYFACQIQNKLLIDIPMAVLNDLFRKIDNLTETVEKQNSAIPDIEKRLKEEMKLREKRLLEQMTPDDGKVSILYFYARSLLTKKS